MSPHDALPDTRGVKKNRLTEKIDGKLIEKTEPR